MIFYKASPIAIEKSKESTKVIRGSSTIDIGDIRPYICKQDLRFHISADVTDETS